MLHRWKQRHQHKARPGPPLPCLVQQFLFKTCSVTLKSVGEKDPIYNSGLDRSYFSTVRNPVSQIWSSRTLRSSLNYQVIFLLFANYILSNKKARREFNFLKRKIFKTQTKLKGKNEEKLRQMFPVKWAVAKSWHIGVAARNTLTVVSDNKDCTEGQEIRNIKYFPGEIPPKC